MTRGGHIPIGSDVELQEALDAAGGGVAPGSDVSWAPSSFAVAVESAENTIDLTRDDGDDNVGEIVVEQGVTLYQADGTRRLFLGVTASGVSVGAILQSAPFTFTPLFRIDEDGSVHIKTGKSVVADL